MKPARFCTGCGVKVHKYNPQPLCEDCRSALNDPTPDEIEAEKKKIREENIAAQIARTHYDNWEMSIRDPRVFRLKMD
jgi:hypothetical protein